LNETKDFSATRKIGHAKDKAVGYISCVAIGKLEWQVRKASRSASKQQ